MSRSRLTAAYVAASLPVLVGCDDPPTKSDSQGAGPIAATFASFPPPTTQPKWYSLAAPPAGSSFEADLYVAVSGHASGSNDSTAAPDDFLFAVRENQVDMLLLHGRKGGRELMGGIDWGGTHLTPEADPIDLLFLDDPGAEEEYLYIAANNLDGYRPYDKGGSILRMTSDRVVEMFAANDPHWFPEPRSLAVPKLNAGFNVAMYLSNGTDDGPFDDAPGLVSVSWTGTVAPCIEPSVGGFTFVSSDDASAFDAGLYFAGGTGLDQVFYAASCEVEPSSLHGGVGRIIRRIVGCHGGPFGDFLYLVVANGTVLRLSPELRMEVVLTGFTNAHGLDIAFSADHQRLFVMDARGGRIVAMNGLPGALPFDIADVPG